jgi:hypothetical protein
MLDRETERMVMNWNTTPTDALEAAAITAKTRNFTAEQLLTAARRVRSSLLGLGQSAEYANERARVYEILAEKARREEDAQAAQGKTSAPSARGPQTAGEVYAERIAMADLMDIEGLRAIVDQLRREGIAPPPP